jgi:hypothetical protein
MEVEMKKGGEGRENRGWEEKRRKKRKRKWRLIKGKEEIRGRKRKWRLIEGKE